MSTDEKFPEADSQAGLNTGEKQVGNAADPVSSEIADALDKKVEATAKEKEPEENKDPMQKLKSTVIISAVVMAVVGAAFAVAKKLREK